MAWPQDRTQAETLNDLIVLSKVSNADLQHVNLDNLRHLEEQYIQYKSIPPGNREKNLIAYNSLNTEDERNIFKTIHSNLSEHNGNDVTAILIDSVQCDRKSFLIMCVSITLDTEITYVVFRRVLAGTHKKTNKMSRYTTHRFLMSKLDLDIDNANGFFMEPTVIDGNPDSFSSFDMLQKIIRLPLERTFNLLILDEYTTLSPWYVLWMYWIAKYHRIPILFFGDKIMHGSIQESRFYSKNNYTIAEILAQPNCHSLNILDTPYRQKVASFKEILDPTENVDLNKDHTSMLKKLSQHKFNMKENFKAIYLAQYYANLYQRAYRMKKHVEMNGIEHYCIPYRIEGTNQDVPIDEMRRNGQHKFLEFLLLIKGFMYTYAPSPREEKFVRFENLNKETGIVTVTDIKDGSEYQLSRVTLEDSDYGKIESDWLRHFTGGNSLCQYPLRLLCKTYLSVQGLIMPADCKVELDMNPCCERYSDRAVRANAVYVGLSSVTSEEQLGKFHFTKFGTRPNRRRPCKDLAEIARYLRDAPRDDIYDNSGNTEDLERHFKKYLKDAQ